MSHTFQLAKHGKQLWTRELARKVRAELQKVLEEAVEGDTIILDLKNVEVFDFSFANELFGKTLFSLPGEYPGRFIIFDHLTDYTRENLINALDGMKLMAIVRKTGANELIGKTHATDMETFDKLSKLRQPCTAAVLADKFQVNLTAMHERLNKLVEAGVVRRQNSTSAAGRTQFLYSAPR